jgi:hypothetical protein
MKKTPKFWTAKAWAEHMLRISQVLLTIKEVNECSE